MQIKKCQPNKKCPLLKPLQSEGYPKALSD